MIDGNIWLISENKTIKSHTKLPSEVWSSIFLFIKWLVLTFFSHLKSFSNWFSRGWALITYYNWRWKKDDKVKKKVLRVSWGLIPVLLDTFQQKHHFLRKEWDTFKTTNHGAKQTCLSYKQWHCIKKTDMFEAYGQPTVKYKSITIVTIITSIYTICVGWIHIYMFSRPCWVFSYKNKVWSFLLSGFVPFHGFLFQH